MRTITVKYNVYNYNELSEKAKEKVKNDYIEDLGKLAFVFTNNCNDRLNELFPNSDLNVQYSLCYSQGDGVNIYGKVSLKDVLEHIKEHFSEKELKYFDWVFNNFESTSYCKMDLNRHYDYCICDKNDYIEELIWEMEYSAIRGIKYNLLEKLNDIIRKYFVNLCAEFENSGYDFFYPDLSDEEMEEICNVGEYEFYEDGKMYNE